MATSDKQERISLVTRRDLHRDLRKLAQKHERSVSGEYRAAAQAWVEQNKR